MFTGIIEEMGRLRHVEKTGDSMILEVEAKAVLEDVKIGDSIAINGVCLTVVSFTEQSFKADVMPETYRKTSLHQCNIGDRVNLERAMSAQGRFGGHLVQGHVDGTGTIDSLRQEGNAVVFTIKPDQPSLLNYMIPKGSIAVDGISLTLVDVTQDAFTVSIIPHTLQETTLGLRKRGDAVNIECDMMGKYVQRFVMQMLGNKSSEPESGKTGMTEEWLKQHGFMKE